MSVELSWEKPCVIQLPLPQKTEWVSVELWTESITFWKVDCPGLQTCSSPYMLNKCLMNEIMSEWKLLCFFFLPCLTTPSLYLLPVSYRETQSQQWSRFYNCSLWPGMKHKLVWSSGFTINLPDLQPNPPYPKSTICFGNAYSWPGNWTTLWVLFLGMTSLTLITNM